MSKPISEDKANFSNRTIKLTNFSFSFYFHCSICLCKDVEKGLQCWEIISIMPSTVEFFAIVFMKSNASPSSACTKNHFSIHGDKPKRFLYVWKYCRNGLTLSYVNDPNTLLNWVATPPTSLDGPPRPCKASIAACWALNLWSRVCKLASIGRLKSAFSHDRRSEA